MATSLDKDVVRETTVMVDGREVVITLSTNQDIRLKLKGMKSGEVKIPINDLYDQLTGKITEEEKPVQTAKSLSVVREEKSTSDNPMISLYDLRSLSAVSGLDTPTIVKFDGIISDLIKNEKERKKALNKK